MNPLNISSFLKAPSLNKVAKINKLKKNKTKQKDVERGAVRYLRLGAQG